MTLGDKIVDIMKKGYEVRFLNDDVAHGMRIRVQKSVWRFEEFIGFDVLDCSHAGTDYILRYIIDRLVHEIDEKLKGDN